MRSPIKSKASGGRLNLFFLEMIIVLLFFSIASAVIMKTFVTADRISRENGMLERMSFYAQSAAEIFSDTGDIGETAEKLFGIDPESLEKASFVKVSLNDVFTYVKIPLSDDFTYSYMEDAEIFVTMQFVYTERYINHMRISFEDDNGNILYEIDAAAYTPERTVAYIYDEE